MHWRTNSIGVIETRSRSTLPKFLSMIRNFDWNQSSIIGEQLTVRIIYSKRVYSARITTNHENSLGLQIRPLMVFPYNVGLSFVEHCARKWLEQSIPLPQELRLKRVGRGKKW